MITREQIRQLIHRPDGEAEILSAYVDSPQARDLAFQWLAESDPATTAPLIPRFQHLDSDRPGHHREPLGSAFERLETWLGSGFDGANKAVAVFTEIGDDWFEAYQLPVPVANRLDVGDRPVIAPLVEILGQYHHHGVVLVDREHLRLMSLYLDRTLNEREVETEPYPAPHDVKRGGFSAKDYQDRKAEETKHFFREFANEVARFVRRHDPDDLILLGTHENVQKFREFLPESARTLITHEDRMDIEATPPEIRERLDPVFQRRTTEEEARVVQLLRDRVREAHRAVAGLDDTLEELQEGKLGALVIARELDHEGGRCESCGFFLSRLADGCPYCGGDIRRGIDLGEASIDVDFVPASALGELGGVGGLLRY